MKSSIIISEEKIDNEIVEKIKISGATNHQEALDAAEEWCDENNCILVSKEFESPIRESENTSTIFYAKIGSDDYE